MSFKYEPQSRTTLLLFLCYVKLLGYSEPEFVTIDTKDDASDVSYLEDIGPKFIHTYEIINLGHQTVHNAQVKKTFGNILTALCETLFCSDKNENKIFIINFQIQMKLPVKTMGQTISYLHELPSIRYFSKSSIITNSPNPIGRCELAKDDTRQEGSFNIINPKSLNPRNSNNQHRGKRDTTQVGNILVHINNIYKIKNYIIFQ